MATNWQAALSNARAALMRRGRSEQDAEDIVQEAWMRLAVYQRDHVVQAPEAFLMRAAINLSIDAHRVQMGRGEEVLIDDVVLVDTTPGVEAIMLGRERMARMGVCLGRLNCRTREIFLAHRVDGMAYQELAQRHGVSVTAIEKHVAKATMLISTWMEGW